MISRQPQRIQRKRTKGWRLPAGAKCVTRPGKYGNPFKVGTGYIKTAADAVAAFRAVYFTHQMRSFREQIRKELKGHDLACYCPLGQPCHADILLEIANNANESPDPV